jgi:cysteine synthase
VCRTEDFTRNYQGVSHAKCLQNHHEYTPTQTGSVICCPLEAVDIESRPPRADRPSKRARKLRAVSSACARRSPNRQHSRGRELLPVRRTLCGTIVEATAGNTGLGLALVGGRSGYRIVLVVPDKMAREKILHCKAMGAEVVLTRSDVARGHHDYYQDLAEAITARTPGALFINQFANPANPQAHETTTGPEIFRQMQGSVDAVVVGVGSGGTLTGIGRFMARNSPATRMILADPVGSVLAPLVESGHAGEAGSWAVEGIGEDFVPPNADLSLVHKAYAISDPVSFAAARDLLRQEGVLAGSSTGTLLAAALSRLRNCQSSFTLVSTDP